MAIWSGWPFRAIGSSHAGTLRTPQNIGAQRPDYLDMPQKMGE